MNRHFLSRRATRGLALGTAIGALVLAGAAPASASPANPTPGLGVQPAHGNGHGGGPGGGGGSGGGGGGGGSTTNGLDVSYPQCGSTTLPTSAAFVIVGVNGGLANDPNPCLGPSATYSLTQSELYWASTATSASSVSLVPTVALYVNTADPGNVYNNAPVADWPTSSISADPYGKCKTTLVKYHGQSKTVGINSDACAWQYGYNMAAQDAGWLTSAATAINSTSVPTKPGSYQWWLDVETANTWQSDTTMNVADLEGMIAGLRAADTTTTVSVGAYSTATQWSSIVGGSVTGSSALNNIPNWIPGATSLTGAQANCTPSLSFTGGVVSITQWTATLDNDYACPK